MQLNRRKLLKFLGLGGLGAGSILTLPRLTEVNAKDLRNQLHEILGDNLIVSTIEEQKSQLTALGVGGYRDFELRWTGWKGAVDNLSQVGQWLAYGIPGTKAEGVYFYSSIPGYSGRFSKGESFNIALRPWQIYITYEISEEEKEFEKQKAYEILLMEIDRFHQPLKSFFLFKGHNRNGYHQEILESEVSVQESLQQAVADYDSNPENFPFLFYKDAPYRTKPLAMLYPLR